MITSTGTRSLALFYYWHIRMRNDNISKQLDGLSIDNFSEIYLFFDYDMHQTNLGKGDNADVVKQMLESFDNETENGKLYMSYPMVEH